PEPAQPDQRFVETLAHAQRHQQDAAHRADPRQGTEDDGQHGLAQMSFRLGRHGFAGFQRPVDTGGTDGLLSPAGPADRADVVAAALARADRAVRRMGGAPAALTAGLVGIAPLLVERLPTVRAAGADLLHLAAQRGTTN